MFAAIVALSLAACRSPPPMETPAPHVDLPRYMGDWYVIASIPTRLEKDAHDAVESYRLDPDGTIQTTFRYRKDTFDGRIREIHARGFVKDPETKAVWGMQFFWPVKSDYRIAWIADDYSQVVVAREKRDYLWIMARSPHISDGDYRERVNFAASLGYDPAKIARVPQQQR
jgi:apolipoprotein D and lipocalin family protein